MNIVQPGDFCCVPVSGPVGKLISIGEWLNGSAFGNYDHAEIYVGNADADGPYGYTFGAYTNGARYVPLPCQAGSLPGALWSSGHIELTSLDRNNIITECQNLIGTPYSSLDYFALAAHRFHIPVPFLKHYIDSTKHMICSQLVDYIYMTCEVRLFNDGRWPGYVTPADLAELIKDR